MVRQYLDTHPKGALVGAWIALENINKESGPFRVYEGSHRKLNAYKLQSLDHNDFIKENLSENIKYIEILASCIYTYIYIEHILN